MHHKHIMTAFSPDCNPLQTTVHSEECQRRNNPSLIFLNREGGKSSFKKLQCGKEITDSTDTHFVSFRAFRSARFMINS